CCYPMGKSPGSWIKAVLFRKKHSKSRSSKNGSNDKRVSVRASEDPEGDSLVISSPRRLPQHETSNVGYENGTPTSISTATSFAASQSMESRSYSVLLSDADKQTQNQAAAKAQAAFRGYLARRAFRALKGIIRLQAVIRGHLVRRQAVATLFCMQAIVKLQAVVRRQNVRLSSATQNFHFHFPRFCALILIITGECGSKINSESCSKCISSSAPSCCADCHAFKLSV
ncbi:hypothetical protein M569_03338, partial [Genlisea aurea]